MARKLTPPVALLLTSVFLAGCFQTIAIKTMAGIMDYGFEAFNEESDTQLAKEGLGSNLKLIEALIKGDPDNEKLLIYASQGPTQISGASTSRTSGAGS